MSVLQVSVTTADHIQADPQAPVTLVEYGDYECPGCGAAYPIVKAVWGHFDKRLRFVFRNFPLLRSILTQRAPPKLRSSLARTACSGRCMTIFTRTSRPWAHLFTSN